MCGHAVEAIRLVLPIVYGWNDLAVSVFDVAPYMIPRVTGVSRLGAGSPK